VITDGEAGYPFADGGDNARSLVAHDQRQGDIPFAAKHMEIRVAHPGCGDFDSHFAGSRSCKVDFVNVNMCPVKNDGLHVYSLVFTKKRSIV
jgi:hypothetical protein